MEERGRGEVEYSAEEIVLTLRRRKLGRVGHGEKQAFGWCGECGWYEGYDESYEIYTHTERERYREIQARVRTHARTLHTHIPGHRTLVFEDRRASCADLRQKKRYKNKIHLYHHLIIMIKRERDRACERARNRQTDGRTDRDKQTERSTSPYL